jgi:tRNA(adenine34) deaminase
MGAPTSEGTRDGTTEETLMGLALAEAALALEHGDVPVGAIVVDASGAVIGRGHNRREVDADPLGHAELAALREAAAHVGGWRLDGCTLVVTLEPCTMCAGALVQARIATLVYGADDARAGAVVSLFDAVRDPRLNHTPRVVRGVRAEECAALLREFFAQRRGQTAVEG